VAQQYALVSMCLNNKAQTLLSYGDYKQKWHKSIWKSRTEVEMLLEGGTRAYEPEFFMSATTTRNPAPKRGLVETSLSQINVSQRQQVWLSERPIFSF